MKERGKFFFISFFLFGDELNMEMEQRKERTKKIIVERKNSEIFLGVKKIDK